MIRAMETYQRNLEGAQPKLDHQIELLERRWQKLGYDEYRKRYERFMLRRRQLKRNSVLAAMTLAALRAPSLERLVLDPVKLATVGIESPATTSLRSILVDEGVIALVPSSFRPALLDGLRAGALGEAMLIGFGTKER
jgi:hypothetical protein